MTNEERDLIARFVARVSGSTPAGAGGSVPSSAPALPPIDPEADAHLAQQFQQHPEARYRITQTAIVQEAALANAQNQIQRLQWELDQSKQAMQQAQQMGQQQPQRGGLFGGLFGGGGVQQPQRQAGPFGQQGPNGGYAGGNAPTPQYPPNYQPGMFQRGGSGFLGSALTTAAGVAGGMVVGNALMNAFSGPAESGGEATAAAASPWGGDAAGATPAADAAGFDGGDAWAGAGTDVGQGGGDVMPASWDQSAGDSGMDAGFDGGGFDGGLDSGFDDV